MKKQDYLAQLSRDLDRWITEGLVDPSMRDALAASAGAGLQEGADRARLVIVMGALAIGIGLLTIVASNWSAFPPAARLGLILALMLLPVFYNGLHWVQRRPVLADLSLAWSALLIGGTLVTIGQAFHTGSTNVAFLTTWSLGALALAGLMRSNAALFVGAVLVVILTIVGWFESMESTRFTVIGLPPPGLVISFGAAAFLARRYRALASWHLVCVVGLSLIGWLALFLVGHLVAKADPVQAQVFFSITTLLFVGGFVLIVALRFRFQRFGRSTLAGWLAWGFALHALLLLVALYWGPGGEDFSASRLVFWIAAVAVMMTAAALIGYGGLRGLNAFRVAGVLLFIGVATILFFTQAGMLSAGLTLILTGTALIVLLRFAERTLLRMARWGEPT